MILYVFGLSQVQQFSAQLRKHWPLVFYEKVCFLSPLLSADLLA